METYVIHVTKQCNLDCMYCYEQDKTSVYTWEEVKGFIDEMLELRTSNSFNIEFLGGEPMLAFDLIKKSYEYLESNSEILVGGYFITTNGTILPPDAVGYFKNNPKIVFAISMDGAKTANQLRVFKDSRLNSYEAVMANIRKLLAEGVEPTVHFVTHPYNIYLLEKSVKQLYSEGIRSVDFGIVESTISIDAEFAELYIEQVKRVSDLIKAGELAGLYVGVLFDLKPVEDIRTYIRDKATGKLVAETYGRSGNDVVDTDKYDIVQITEKSEVTKLIDYMRATVFAYHNTL